MPEDKKTWKVSPMENKQWEKMMLRQIAGFLAKEKLINPRNRFDFYRLSKRRINHWDFCGQPFIAGAVQRRKAR